MDQQQQQSGQQQARQQQPLYDISQGGHYGKSQQEQFLCARGSCPRQLDMFCLHAEGSTNLISLQAQVQRYVPLSPVLFERTNMPCSRIRHGTSGFSSTISSKMPSAKRRRERSSTTPPTASLAQKLWTSADKIGLLEAGSPYHADSLGAETREQKVETFRRAWWSADERQLEAESPAHDKELQNGRQIKQDGDHHQIDPAINQNGLTDTDNEQLSAQGYVPHTELYGGLWSNVRYLDALVPLAQCD